MTQRHENFEQHHQQVRHDFADHHHVHPSHREFQHHHHQHHSQHAQESHSKNLVDKGHLPEFHLTNNGDVQAKTNPGTSAEGTKPAVDQAQKGEVKFTNLHGAAVDTDGSGAYRHTEDKYRKNQTNLTPNGKSLDTDKDNFVALPKGEMARMGIHVGDKGFLQRTDTGEKVPVVFGDVSNGKAWQHGNGQPEASVAALKGLGFNNVNGRNGVDKNVGFNLIMQRGSADGNV